MKRRTTPLLIYGVIVLVLAGGWSAYLEPAWADLRYRAAYADFQQAKRRLEALVTAEWQDRVLGLGARRDAVEAAAIHIDACESVGGLGSAVQKGIERLESAGGALRTSEKRELSRQLVSAASEYAGAYQRGLEDFCDRALDAVVALMSPKPGDDVIGIRRAASGVLKVERKGAENPAARIQTIWRRLDGLLFKGFGPLTR
ncbi:MAG: hypothetical protein AUH31_03745 [Armatimonadetes bacterium 13_1_40CM_64_14]|nr:MAG: hypothetical protein AUH31_03745 [Armatimonadetes bacterium 13_1_40CM_64_14]